VPREFEGRSKRSKKFRNKKNIVETNSGSFFYIFHEEPITMNGEQIMKSLLEEVSKAIFETGRGGQ
jgi:hypothetical protein